MTIPTRKACKKELTRIISFYNDERPHMSIGNQTPSVAHTQSGPQQRMWKNPWENADDLFSLTDNQYRYKNQKR